MPHPLTIVVGGYLVGFPLGGHVWHPLNYLLSLQQMGHDVYFLEDTDSWAYPYNPLTQSVGTDSTYGRQFLETTFAEVGLPLRYCYYSQFEDCYYGMSRDDLHAVLQRADLLIYVSGVTPLRPERPRPRRTCVIDTDPVFTQLRMGSDTAFLDYYRQFDAVATFGRLIGTPACPLPTHGLNWIATHQPVSLPHWPLTPPTASRAFTTVGKWEHSAERHVEFRGRRYLSSKGGQWLQMLDLPRRTSWEMGLAMQAIPPDIAAQFTSHGWKLSDPEQLSRTCATYRQFLQQSAGEFTVAKEIYSGIPSGWFSDRSSTYLASGRPVVTQNSGFDQWLPTGQGLFSFRTVEEAADALNRIAADYPAHCAAARHLAERYFDGPKVLQKLLEQVL